MAGRVEGKVAFITGAARGQGRSHAVRLAEEGADIIAVDLCGPMDTVPYPLGTSDELDETVKLVEKTGRRILAKQADVRDAAALVDVLAEGVAEFGRLDIVSANAGIASYHTPQDLPVDAWREVIDVNLSGAWYTAQAAIPHLIAGGNGGSIVITSSAAGLQPYPNVVHYVASKHGVVGLTRALAIDLGQYNIRVNSIAPTNVNTGMIHNEPTYRVFMPDAQELTREVFIPASQSLNVLPIPWVEPEDISNALLYLVSDDGRYVTGSVLQVDAGTVIK